MKRLGLLVVALERGGVLGSEKRGMGDEGDERERERERGVLCDATVCESVRE